MISFDKLHWQLTELEKAQGTKAKQALLQKYVDDPDFVWMVKMALDQGHSFGIEEIPDFILNLAEPDDERLVELMEALKSTAGVSDELKAKLFAMMSTSRSRYNVCSRILRKDLRCGVQAKTINKVKPGLVFKVPYQRCSGYDRIDKMTWPAMLQRKANGMFVYLLPTSSFMTRQGHQFTIDGNPVSEFVQNVPDVNRTVLLCELVVLDECGVVMPRAEGNGLINSFLKGTQDAEVAANVRAYTWGYVTPEEFQLGASSRPYLQTWQNLNKWLPITTPDMASAAPIKVIETWFVKTLEEAKIKCLELIAADEEGGIVKSMSPDFVWKDESSCDFQIKMKAEAEADFRIIDVYAGDPRKKYAGLLGGIRVSSKEGRIISDVGGGFTDFDRQLGLKHWEKLIGKIVTVKFNGVTVNRDKPEIKALDHPRFIEVRYDKDEDDTLEYCEKLLRGEVK